MGLFEKLSEKAKAELLKESGVYDSLEDLYRSMHLMSVDQLKELEDKIKDIIQSHNKNIDLGEKDELTPLDEFNFCDDINSLAFIADSFDKMGYFEAADIIDSLSEQIVSKSIQPGRIYAKLIRKIKKMAKTPDWMPGPLTNQQIPPAMTAQQMPKPYQPMQQQQATQQPQQWFDTSGLTQEQINRVNRIQNPGLRSQWINELKRRNMMPRQQQQPVVRQPVQQPVPQPQPTQPQVQPVTPAPTAQPGRKPFDIEEHMRAVSGQPTAEDDEIKRVYEEAEIMADD